MQRTPLTSVGVELFIHNAIARARARSLAAGRLWGLSSTQPPTRERSWNTTSEPTRAASLSVIIGWPYYPGTKPQKGKRGVSLRELLHHIDISWRPGSTKTSFFFFLFRRPIDLVVCALHLDSPPVYSARNKKKKYRAGYIAPPLLIPGIELKVNLLRVCVWRVLSFFLSPPWSPSLIPCLSPDIPAGLSRVECVYCGTLSIYIYYVLLPPSPLHLFLYIILDIYIYIKGRERERELYFANTRKTPLASLIARFPVSQTTGCLLVSWYACQINQYEAGGERERETRELKWAKSSSCMCVCNMRALTLEKPIVYCVCSGVVGWYIG